MTILEERFGSNISLLFLEIGTCCGLRYYPQLEVSSKKKSPFPFTCKIWTRRHLSSGGCSFLEFSLFLQILPEHHFEGLIHLPMHTPDTPETRCEHFSKLVSGTRGNTSRAVAECAARFNGSTLRGALKYATNIPRTRRGYSLNVMRIASKTVRLPFRPLLRCTANTLQDPQSQFRKNKGKNCKNPLKEPKINFFLTSPGRLFDTL